MSTRGRVLFAAGALLLPVLFLPLLMRPVLAIAACVAAVGLYLASRSVAYPLALSAVFAVSIGILGRNPFPNGAIAKLSFVWVGTAVLIAVLRRQDVLPFRILFTAPVALTIATAWWMVARLGTSPSPSYGDFKLQLFVAENLALMLAAVVVASRRRDFHLFLVLTLVMAVVSSIVLARGLASGQAQGVVGGRFALSSDYNPIIFGRDAARGISIAVFFLLASTVPWLRAFALLTLPLLAVSFTAAGSRGPALGLVAGLLTLLLLTLRDRASRRRLLLVAAGAAGGAYLVAQLVPAQNVSRSLSFLVGDTSQASSNGRSALWELAWNGFVQHPLAGLGTGGYASIDAFNLYPHNLLLETAVELGVVGLVLVVATIVLGTARLASVWRLGDDVDRRDATIVASLIAAAVVNALFSGDIAVNHAVWISLGLVVGLRLRVQAVPAVPDRMRWLRGRRPARAAPPAAPPPAWETVARRSRGRIVAPAAESVIDGVVRVEAEPAQTGRPVQAMRIEWSPGDGRWALAAAVDDRAFEVAVGEGPAAIVRSRWLADLIADALSARVTPSRRRPWATPRVYVFEWDTTAFAPGRGALRAVSVDADETETESPPVALEIVATSVTADAPAPVDSTAVALHLGAEAAALERRRIELDERARALDARDTALVEERAREVARHELDVRERADVATARERALARAAADLAAQEAALGTREADVDAARAGLERQASELAELRARLQEREAPEPAPEPVPWPVAIPPVRRPTLDDLEHAVAARPELDPYRVEELRAIIYYLRDFVGLDGAIPPEFDALVDDEFGPLL